MYDKKLLYRIRDITKNEVTSETEKELKSLLQKSLTMLPVFTYKSRFDEVIRLTINKNIVRERKRIKNRQHLSYPPASLVKKYGRCNLPNQSVLYSAFYKLTVLEELRPEVGEMITISVWHAREDSKLTYFPIFFNQPPEGDTLNPRTFEIHQDFINSLAQYPAFLRNASIELMQFIADCFSKQNDTGNPLNYLVSAFFSNIILNDMHNGDIDAILYPSVQQKLNFENLVIKPEVFDKVFELVEVRDMYITQCPINGGQGWKMLGLGACSNINNDTGVINWTLEDNTHPFETSELLKSKYGIDIS